MELQVTEVFEWNWDAINAVDESGRRRYKYIINEGSSRSSKTMSLIDCVDVYGRSNENKRMTVWRDTKTDCKKTVLNDVKKHLRRTGRWLVGHRFHSTESILTYVGESTLEIHGTDDEETVHGLTQDVAWLNEPYKISKDTFDQIDQRTSDFIFIDWNPKKAHWIDDLKKDKRAIVIHSTFKNNPFCPEEQRFKILSYQPVSMCEAVLTGLKTEEEILSGNFEGLEGEIFEEAVRCVENEEKNSASAYKWSVYGLGMKAEKPNRIFKFHPISVMEFNSIQTSNHIVASDWGSVDPWGILEGKYYDGCLYLNEKNYISENNLRAKLSAVELSNIQQDEEGLVVKKFNELNIDKEMVIVCDNNRPNKIKALRSSGFDYAIACVKGKIEDGIDLVNGLKVYYTVSSTNLEYEQENYSYKVDRYGVVLEEPEDVDNHLMDCTRYIAEFFRQQGIITKV